MIKITINNYKELVERLSGFDLSKNNNMLTFVQLVQGLGGGCSCNRASRIKFCEMNYLNIANLMDDSMKNFIKQKYGAESVEILTDGALFYKF